MNQNTNHKIESTFDDTLTTDVLEQREYERLLAVQDLEEEYERLKALFGLDSGCWDMLHLNFSRCAFCPKNQASFIAEYLLWQEFVEKAKAVGFIYYFGIDKFLEEYKEAVHSRVHIDSEEG